MFVHVTGVVPFVAEAIIVLRILAHIGRFAQAKICFWAIRALTMAVRSLAHSVEKLQNAWTSISCEGALSVTTVRIRARIE